MSPPLLVLPGFTPGGLRTPDKVVFFNTAPVDAGVANGLFKEREVDAVLIQLPQAQAERFFDALVIAVRAQLGRIGHGAVALTSWVRQGHAVVAAFETEHSNVSLMTMEEVAGRHGVTADAFLIGVSRGEIQRLAGPEVQAVLLT